MRYANVDGIRIEAAPKLKGICASCGSKTISKCGKHKIWHWAHEAKSDCDKWTEPETEWHRAWKDHFPKEWQEVIHVDQNTNEKHIADVRTPSGLVLEFQHSVILPDEMTARNNFYGNLIWVVDGLRSELDKYYFSLSLSKPIPEEPHIFPIHWHGRSKIMHNWSCSTRPTYLDFGTDILWRLHEFSAQTRRGFLQPFDKRKLIREWAVA